MRRLVPFLTVLLQLSSACGSSAGNGTGDDTARGAPGDAPTGGPGAPVTVPESSGGAPVGTVSSGGSASQDALPPDLGAEPGTDAAPSDESPLGLPWADADPGALPDRVLLKTNAESYNRRYYFATRQGGIWLKPNVDRTGVDGEWQALALPPAMSGRVAQISADDNEMIAVLEDRQIWSGTGMLGDPLLFSWKSSWGFPFWTGPGQWLPDDLMRWEWSVLSPQEDVVWTDPAGNDQPVGQAKVSHIWMLPKDQSRLVYIDPWLPLDLSYGMCGPERDRFRAENITASGSTVFVVNRYGDMFTRLFDFDISGADTVFFSYSYEDQTGAFGIPPIQLPAPTWIEHPKIDGQITNLISIHKVGQGAIHRVMRVEGLGPNGESGYYEKDVTDLDDGDWVFVETGEPLRGALLDNSTRDRSDENLAPSKDFVWVHGATDPSSLDPAGALTSAGDFAAEIVDFNVYCSPATLRIAVGGDVSFDLVLHTADTIRTEPRAPGLDATPRAFNATIEVPDELSAVLASRPAKVRAFVEQYLLGQKFTKVGLSATSTELVICPTGAMLAGACIAQPWVFEPAP